MRHRSRMRIASVVVATALIAGCAGTETSGPDVTDLSPSAVAGAYLDGAISVLQANAFYKSRVDWVAVRATARAISGGATTPFGTYPGIKYALDALGDHHSFLQLPVAGSANLDALISRGTVGALAMLHPSDSLDGELLSGACGYLRVPTYYVPAGTPDITARSTAMADTLQALVAAVDAQNPCGCVVDLRHDLGGRRTQGFVSQTAPTFS